MSAVWLQIGQCGNQIGQEWCQIITSANKKEADMYPFYSRDGKLSVICVDSEQKVVRKLQKQIRSGALRESNLILGKQGRGNNWAYGYHDIGLESEHSLFKRTMESLRKEAERRDCYCGTVLFHSLSGGTGSGLQLNIKKTKLLTTGTATSLRIDNEDIEVLDRFCLLESTVNSKGSSSQEISCRLALGRVEMKALERLFRCRDVSTPTKIRSVQTMVFPVTLYGCENWTLKKQGRKNIDTFELWCWRRLLRRPWTARKTNKWIIEQINPEFSLEAQMTRLKLSYFGHIMQRPSSLEKSIIFILLGKVEGKRRRGRPAAWWMDPIMTAMNAPLRDLQGQVEDRPSCRESIDVVAKSRH
ncbi:uncharacterized protein LOC128329604 isoform X3 [Hemicordylus capensis]|uniref:uncharacterized protein LOC128329604 isoform X3 n=1 Tax=Hemicordylus capensis TaxID=884348 RepID=UPI00230291AF|nr:uncharacterized protein LOC128329604 isoform X3 [Hemicordylus capensis]